MMGCNIAQRVARGSRLSEEFWGDKSDRSHFLSRLERRSICCCVPGSAGHVEQSTDRYKPEGFARIHEIVKGRKPESDYTGHWKENGIAENGPQLGRCVLHDHDIRYRDLGSNGKGRRNGIRLCGEIHGSAHVDASEAWLG